MTTLITIANQKGGVAKTTTAITLAHGLALKGKRVLLIDLDPQGQCSTALNLAQAPQVFNWLVTDQAATLIVQPTDREGLSLLPGDKQTAVAQIVITAQQQSVAFIAERVHDLQRHGAYHYILFDTAPSVGGLQERALWASHLVLIPCATDFLAAEGVAQITQTLEMLHTRSDWTGHLLGVLPTFYDEVTRESVSTLNDLQQTFGAQVLAPIHRATILRECAAEGKTIFELDGHSRAAQEYAALVHHVLEVC